MPNERLQTARLGQLGRMLAAAGVPYEGISIDGRIDYAPAATEEQTLLGAAIVETWRGEAAIQECECALIDGQTEERIGTILHANAPTGEQIGILRDQLVQIVNALGIEVTADFARLNEVAVKAIEAARAEKEAL